jgi:ubiquinone/menaquinone biosynthesis C-methylase UbiE
LKDIPPDYVWNRLNLEKTDVIVEIGAGTAFFSIAFLQLIKPMKIYACDVSEAMIDWIKENVAPKYPKIIPMQTEESSVTLDDETADLVIMINLHHESDNPSLILAESYRILKPGGTVFVVDWKKKDMDEGPPTHIK